uniref:Uncharacterized protein n=1 Tax=Parascaris equorum TaxID=6256 RepID=A0A914RRX1_PAREQ
MCPHSNETFAKVQMLFAYHIITWPNFSSCLPHCGMCQICSTDVPLNMALKKMRYHEISMLI